MYETQNYQFYESALFQVLGEEVQVNSSRSIPGGCINNGVRLETNQGTYFFKWNDQEGEELFQKEEIGLQLLQRANAVRIPSVYGRGVSGSRHFLVLEYIEKGAPNSGFWENFGKNLANQHHQTADKYGLDHDNHIGRLPQKNNLMDNWIDFFIDNRLEVQLGLAIYNNYIDKDFAKKFRNIYAQLPGILPEEPPSLLHGDLWSGNFMVAEDGEACIFDPAVYYGNREIELAFTRLFGGFDLVFYQSYHEAYPLEPGFEDRIDIYNLYPLLVHVNLFGTSYLSGIQRTIHRYQ